MPDADNPLPSSDRRLAEFSFHLEEFKSLRDEIARLDQAKRQYEIFTIMGIGLITAWLFTQQSTIEADNMTIIWWSPLVVAALGYAQTRAYVRRSYQVGEYLNRLEDSFAARGLGWEAFLAAKRKPPEGARARTIRWFWNPGSVSTVTKVIWTIVFVLLAAMGARFCGLEGFGKFFTAVIR